MSEHSPSEAPDVAVEGRELRDVLQSAIGRLPPIYRSVFILRAVEEVSVEEAARCLQVSDAVIRTHRPSQVKILFGQSEGLGPRCPGEAPRQSTEPKHSAEALNRSVGQGRRRR